MNKLITQSIERHIGCGGASLPQEHEAIISELVSGLRKYPITINSGENLEKALTITLTALISALESSAKTGIQGKMNAIKLIRRMTFANLKDSKEFVEYLIDSETDNVVEYLLDNE